MGGPSAPMQMIQRVARWFGEVPVLDGVEHGWSAGEAAQATLPGRIARRLLPKAAVMEPGPELAELSLDDERTTRSLETLGQPTSNPFSSADNHERSRRPVSGSVNGHSCNPGCTPAALRRERSPAFQLRATDESSDCRRSWGSGAPGTCLHSQYTRCTRRSRSRRPQRMVRGPGRSTRSSAASQARPMISCSLHRCKGPELVADSPFHGAIPFGAASRSAGHGRAEPGARRERTLIGPQVWRLVTRRDSRARQPLVRSLNRRATTAA
jgi:hypothetical protein